MQASASLSQSTRVYRLQASLVDYPQTFDSHVFGSVCVQKVVGSTPGICPPPICEQKAVVFLSAFRAELGRRKESVHLDEVLAVSTGLYTRPGAVVSPNGSLPMAILTVDEEEVLHPFPDDRELYRCAIRSEIGREPHL